MVMCLGPLYISNKNLRSAGLKFLSSTRGTRMWCTTFSKALEMSNMAQRVDKFLEWAISHK
eukprot:10829366-Prorocentrum_lima.AAC.1